MKALRWTALLFALLLRGQGGSGSSVHSLRDFYMEVSEPGQGVPRFVSVSYVDGQLIAYYDSETKKKEPRVPWMQKVTEDDPHYWKRYTDILRDWDVIFRVDLSILRERYNQSAGLHTLQCMEGCDLNEGVPSKGYSQYGYEGRDLISFDKKTLTWTATDAAALITKTKWEAEPAIAQHQKAYLEERCIDWLRNYLRYGNQTLLRKVPPQVKVTQKESSEGMETLLCRAHGFYPKEIDIAWRKDREVWEDDTFHGVISPNADGTYYTWHSITIDPKDRARYRCHVDHDGLLEPLDPAMEEESVPVWVIALGVISAVVVLVLVVMGIVYYTRYRPGAKKGYKAPPGSVQGSDSSVTSDLLPVSEKRRPPSRVML